MYLLRTAPNRFMCHIYLNRKYFIRRIWDVGDILARRLAWEGRGSHLSATHDWLNVSASDA